MDNQRFDRFSRAIARRIMLKAGMGGVAVVAGLRGATPAAGQGASPTPAGIQWLFTVSFRGGQVDPTGAGSGQATITLTDTGTEVLAFSDRPERQSALISTDDLPGLIAQTPDDPVNANLVARLPETIDTAAYVVELLSANIDSSDSTIDLEVTITGGEIAGEAIDIDAVPQQRLRAGYLFIDPECATQDGQDLSTCYG